MQKWDIVRWCGEEFVVLKDYGEYGLVLEVVKGGGLIDNFYWKHGDCVSTKVGNLLDHERNSLLTEIKNKQQPGI